MSSESEPQLRLRSTDEREQHVSLCAGAWETVREHAEREAPQECCGLLIGRALDVRAVWPARNLAGRPQARYDIDPRDHFAAIRHARDRNFEVIGAYHSHPRSAPVPSVTDLGQALTSFLYLIAGPTGAAAWTPRVYLLVEGNFEEYTLVIQA